MMLVIAKVIKSFQNARLKELQSLAKKKKKKDGESRFDIEVLLDVACNAEHCCNIAELNDQVPEKRVSFCNYSRSLRLFYNLLLVSRFIVSADF